MSEGRATQEQLPSLHTSSILKLFFPIGTLEVNAAEAKAMSHESGSRFHVFEELFNSV